jgi:hypothetical protein
MELKGPLGRWRQMACIGGEGLNSRPFGLRRVRHAGFLSRPLSVSPYWLAVECADRVKRAIIGERILNDRAAGRAPLTVTIIALDAARVLPRCLESVRWADEILVLDSGSSDDTAAIAAGFGARVIQQSWLGFGPQKQKAVELASHDWIFSIDTDECVSDPLRSAIEAALRTGTSMVFAMPRCNRFLGRWLRHGEGYPDWSTRLFHRHHARWSDDTVHERVVTSAPIARLTGDLLHESAETIESYLAKQDRYTTLVAHTIRASGRSVSVLSMIGSPIVRFFKFYIVRGGFLDGIPGLIHITIGCWTSFLKYAKAWALQRRAE